MKVLIIGSGGREHALAWKVASSPLVSKVYVAPGNAGTAAELNTLNVDISAEDTDALLNFADAKEIDLVIVGPEVPLVNGVVDAFEARGHDIFGPSAKAAQLEGSKAFSKDFLQRHNIPTADYQVFSETAQALAYLENCSIPIVIKADGLAAGKGVIVAQSASEAVAAVSDMLSGNAFGDAGSRVVIEDFLHGEEASFICMVDGQTALPLASSQDHKARDDGDLGPNTGGMGAYSPAPVVTDDVHQHIMRDIIEPTIAGMRLDGAPFKGFLYAGLMIKNGEAKVIEFNVRLGDPETQPLLARMDADLIPLCQATLRQELHKQSITWSQQRAVGVVMAAGGYPASYEKGLPISGLDSTFVEGVKVFHAGTAKDGKNTVTSGGRVLCVVGTGASVAAAREKAYTGVQSIQWENAFYRNDIAYRAIEREQSLED